MNEKEFVKYVKELNIELDDIKLNQLKKYYNLLIEINEVMNLTTITDLNEVYLKHFYDSLTITKTVDLSKVTSFCDVGTGAGFPGIIIKIVFPDIKVVLIEAMEKRVKFLKKVIGELALENIEVINARAEEYAKANREKFDIVTARAVANINILLEYCIPITKVSGKFVAMKGKEEAISSNALNSLDCQLQNKISFNLPNGAGERNLYLFVKNKKTSDKFPRKYSDIKKKTL